MTQLTTTKPLRITRDFQGTAFEFREDGYFNMTKAAAHFGKRLDNFWANDETRRYMKELALVVANTWNPSELDETTQKRIAWFRGMAASNFHDATICGVDVTAFRKVLTQSVRGQHGGTWGHPKLAVFFARWLSVRFAVWCDAVIEDLLAGRAQLTITKPDESAILALQQRNDEQAAEIGLILTELADALAKVDEVKREAASMRPLVAAANVPSRSAAWNVVTVGPGRIKSPVRNVVPVGHGVVAAVIGPCSRVPSCDLRDLMREARVGEWVGGYQ
ncbi:KilA-N domain-containing protein [Derxia gummosa]|uniref:KilA-N domain-containing protein n=1 Tax=Derxia gummosa DSM 723 TaxID=1121388 RepID=A0A8B6X1G3_9BURK|nr:KilA-N domain-containing protein [Derxia gummosa]